MERIYLNWSIGKTGSQTIHTALLEQPETEAYHLHNLSPESLQEQLQILLDPKQGGEEVFNVRLEALKTGVEIFRKIQTAEKTHREIVIITGVREPISWQLSQFFEARRYSQAEDVDDFLKEPDDYLNRLKERLKQVFTIAVEEGPKIFSWFDEQVKPVVGIDVYKEGFDKEAGYQVYRKGQIVWLVYIMEKWIGRIDELLEKTLGLEVCAKPTNRTEDRTDAFLYYLANRSFKLTEEQIDGILGGGFSTFYTEADRKFLESKWTAKRSARLGELARWFLEEKYFDFVLPTLRAAPIDKDHLEAALDYVGRGTSMDFLPVPILQKGILHHLTGNWETAKDLFDRRCDTIGDDPVLIANTLWILSLYGEDEKCARLACRLTGKPIEDTHGTYGQISEWAASMGLVR